MLKRLTWLTLMLIALVAFVGCSDDDGGVTTPTKTTFQVIAEACTDYVNDSASCPGVMDADVLNDNLAAYTVIDIRSETDFLDGHIPGAYHSSLGSLLGDVASKAIPTDKPFVVACYSGQSAGHAKIALEMLGYECYSLLFGMSSWNEDTRGSWDGGIGDELVSRETTNNNAGLTTHGFPTPIGANVDAAVATMLAGGFKGVDASAVVANPGSYFIVNYFGLADYEGTGASGVPGHIPGAFQFTPYASVGWGEMLENLPTDMPIVVYCWTGQHSSQITAYLNMLGYDAYSLKFGSNRLFHDDLTAHKWTSSAYNDYDLEMGSTPTPAFAAVAAAGIDYVNDSGACPGVMDADVLSDNLQDYTVIDIRALGDYDAGHIPGAVHSSLGTLMSDLTDGTIPTGNPYVVACYSGQSAGHAKIAMEMMGYDVYSLLFGMSSWSADTRDAWDNATVNAALADRNVLTNPETTNQNIGLSPVMYPALTGDAGTAVATAVDGMLAGGFKGISYESLMALSDVFVINYFGAADYLGGGTSGVPGHIPGAFQFTPYESMNLDEMLPYIPADMPVVVYCWTGQHSSQITAYLNMLGYDAYSLTYGSNKLFYDDLSAHKWTAGAYNDYTLDSNLTVAVR